MMSERSPKPHPLTLILSVVALLVSLVGIAMNVLVYRRDNAVNRSYVAPAKLALLDDWSWQPSVDTLQQPINVELTLQNVGKMAASNIQVLLNVEGVFVDTESWEKAAAAPKYSALLAAANQKPDELPPAMSRTYHFTLKPGTYPLFPPGEVERQIRLYRLIFDPVITYSDAVGSHRDEACFAPDEPASATIEKAANVPLCPTNARASVTIPWGANEPKE
jgi:hypothetical protein